MSTSTAADIAQRAKFYNEPDVARVISKNGVPKTKNAMNVLISEGSAGKLAAGVTQQLVDCLSFVVFSVHPQQINVRDNANGKIIAVIAR
jgi:hypothetical protein